MTAAQDMLEDVGNPLDSVEEIMMSQDWSFDRPSPDQLTVHQVTGRHGTYGLTFLWEEEYGAMQFFCEYDLFIPKEREAMAARVLKSVNEQMWLGHFDIPAKRGAPCFRYTTLFRGMAQVSGEDHVRDLVEIAIAASERYYNVFSMLSSSLYLNDDLIDLALTQNAGEA